MTHDNATDIERLRRIAGSLRRCCDAKEQGARIEEAADTIATLRKQLENARSEALEEALVAVVGTNADGDRSALSAYQKCIYAISALKGQP